MKNLSDRFHNITLHVGAHRTGTSSLQLVLHQNQALLTQKGIMLRAPATSGHRNVHNHRPAFNQLYKAVDRSLNRKFFWRMPSSRRTQDALDRYLSPAYGECNELLVSDENILGKAAKAKHKGILYPFLHDRVPVLRELFGENVKNVYLAVRPYDEFIFSYTSMTHVYSRPAVAFDNLAAWLENLRGGWPRVVDHLVEAFPKARITVWPHALFDLRTRVSELCNLEEDDEITIQKGESVNSTPSLEAIRIVAESGGSSAFSKEELDELILSTADTPRPKLAHFISASLVEKMRNRYNEDLELLGSMEHVKVQQKS